jgi:transposase
VVRHAPQALVASCGSLSTAPCPWVPTSCDGVCLDDAVTERCCGSLAVAQTDRLALADHGMRLQVPLRVGLVVDPLVSTKEPQEPTTVTPAEIIYHRRVQVLDRVGQTSVTEACRTFGISRTTYYRWAGRAQRYGLAALLPKGRRPPVMPTATPPDQVEAVLAEAVARPTLGARQLVGHLADRGVRLSPSGVQKLLVRHRLGRRTQRVAALAQLTAATTGILTTDAKDGPFGFCHFAAPARRPGRPGHLLCRQAQRHRPGLAADGGRHRHPLCHRRPGRRGQVRS